MSNLILWWPGAFSKFNAQDSQCVREGLTYFLLVMCYEEGLTEREAHSMPQQTFAEITFEQYSKPTRREGFLDEMNRVVPGQNWWR